MRSPAGELAPAEPSANTGSVDAEILAAIAEQTDWMTDVLSELVRAPTTLGNEEPGQVVVEGALAEIGLEPVDVPMDGARIRAHPLAAPFDWNVDGKRNVVSTWMPREGDAGRSLILNGHIDVVSPEPTAQWGDVDPFGAHREDGWMVGRGAADMKCGLAAILGAIKGLRALDLVPQAPDHGRVGRRGGMLGQRDACRR